MSSTKTLFRYRRIFDKTIEQLTLDEVWGSKPSTFNDSYDFNFSFNLREIRIFLENRKLDLYEIINRLEIPNINNDLSFNIAYWAYDNIKKSLQKVMGVACFCEEINNPMMWGHYANNSRGFAIEYDLDYLVEVLEREYDNRMIDIQRRTLQIHTKPRVRDFGVFKISYVHQKPDLTNTIINELDYWISLIKIAEDEKLDYRKLYNHELHINNTYGNDDNYLSELLISIGTSKNSEWGYEKEWRMILAQQSNSDDYFKMIELKPKAVYLGEKIAPEDEKKLLSIVRDKKVPVYKMFSNPEGNLKLEYIELLMK